MSLTAKRSITNCDIQFWLDNEEQFYCALTDCLPSAEGRAERYVCAKVDCKCVPKDYAVWQIDQSSTHLGTSQRTFPI